MTLALSRHVYVLSAAHFLASYNCSSQSSCSPQLFLTTGAPCSTSVAQHLDLGRRTYVKYEVLRNTTEHPGRIVRTRYESILLQSRIQVSVTLWAETTFTFHSVLLMRSLNASLVDGSAHPLICISALPCVASRCIVRVN